MASQTYNDGKPIAGNLVSMNLTCAADTLYVGMPLKYNSSNDNWEYSVTDCAAIVYEDKTLAAEGLCLCLVSGSEFPANKIVNGSNVVTALDVDNIYTALTNGIVLR